MCWGVRCSSRREGCVKHHIRPVALTSQSLHQSLVQGGVVSHFLIRLISQATCKVAEDEGLGVLLLVVVVNVVHLEVFLSDVDGGLRWQGGRRIEVRQGKLGARGGTQSDAMWEKARAKSR